MKENIKANDEHRMNRRAALTLGASLFPVLALATPPRGSTEGAVRILPPKNPGPSFGSFPNVMVKTHEDKEVRFYDDLIMGKIVMINFMSIRGDGVYPVTSNLVKVQKLLGNRVGRDLFMYSISLDPEQDTPARLRKFAEEKGVSPGWRFLTGTMDAMNLLRGHLFVQRATPTTPVRGGKTPSQCCSPGLIRYGNEALGRWGSVPSRISPESIAKRFSWLGMRSGDAS